MLEGTELHHVKSLRVLASPMLSVTHKTNLGMSWLNLQDSFQVTISLVHHFEQNNFPLSETIWSKDLRSFSM